MIDEMESQFYYLVNIPVKKYHQSDLKEITVPDSGNHLKSGWLSFHI